MTESIATNNIVLLYHRGPRFVANRETQTVQPYSLYSHVVFVDKLAEIRGR